MPERDDERDDNTTGLDSDGLDDFMEGTDPDSVVLGPDSVPYDRAGPSSAAPLTDAMLVEAPTFSLARVIAVALAFTVLGFGLGFLVVTRDREPSAVDLGFTRDMIDHHDQAVQMALIALSKPDLDKGTRNFATEVLLFQRWELGIMDTYLADWHQLRGELERVSMKWMDMGTPVASMPGMASTSQLDELRAATGRDADRLFLTMMREHHRGGVHMSQYAAAHASDGDVRTLAARMASYQQIEVNEYTMLIKYLGFES